jgi:site-specific DNA-methyltransferase (adenine-specific)
LWGHQNYYHINESNVEEVSNEKASMGPVPSSNRYHQVFEYMFIFSKGKPKTVNLIKDRENKEGKSTWKTLRIRQKDGTFIARRNTKPIQRYGTRFNIWQYNVGFDFSTKDIDAECFKIFNQIGRIIIQSYFL